MADWFIYAYAGVLALFGLWLIFRTDDGPKQ